MLSLVIFLISGAVGAVLTYQDPDFKVRILGPDMVATIDRHEMWTHSIVGIKPLASSAIMTNNIGVGFTTFALGITAGLGTIYMMLFNGLLIGVIGMACHLSGMSLQLWSSLPRTAYWNCQQSLLPEQRDFAWHRGCYFREYLPRRDSLTRAGSEAVQLLVGTVPILVIAGLIEAFVSPTGLAISLKFTMAAALFVLFDLYLFGMPGHWPKADSAP